MRVFLGLFLFVTFLVAEYPKVYAQIGDDIYKNLSNIEDLKNTKEFSRYTNEIEIYVYEAQKAKENGFMIENGDNSVDKNLYLEDLRKLVKTNDYFKNLVITTFEKSLSTKNNTLFVETVNSNLLPQSFEQKILDYYNNNVDAIIESGFLAILAQKQRDELEAKNAKKIVKVTPKIKKDSNQEKMERLKKADLEKREAFKKQVEEEEARKKAQIIAKQKKELSN
ncbi:MAG: hypothetical protein RBR59_00660 [Sulfurimonadaceae bacterium]|jgi:hypothetical protein|nr:hypothetical protein [Sulfurimonadaceae bacterium]